MINLVLWTALTIWTGTAPDQQSLTATFDLVNGYVLKLNDKAIFTFEDPTGGGPRLVWQSTVAVAPRFVALLEVYQGDSCPAMNVLVAVHGKDDAFASEPFGNCEGPRRVAVDGERVTLEFAARNVGTQRLPAATWDFAQKKLSRRHAP